MKGWDVSSRTLLTVRFSAGEDRSRFETMIERLEDGRGVFLSVAVWMNTKLARLGFHFRHILESPPLQPSPTCSFFSIPRPLRLRSAGVSCGRWFYIARPGSRHLRAGHVDRVITRVHKSDRAYHNGRKSRCQAVGRNLTFYSVDRRITGFFSFFHLVVDPQTDSFNFDSEQIFIG